MSTKDSLNQAKKTINVLHNLVLQRCEKDGHVMIGGMCKWCLSEQKNAKTKVN